MCLFFNFWMMKCKIMSNKTKLCILSFKNWKINTLSSKIYKLRKVRNLSFWQNKRRQQPDISHLCYFRIHHDFITTQYVVFSCHHFQNCQIVNFVITFVIYLNFFEDNQAWKKGPTFCPEIEMIYLYWFKSPYLWLDICFCLGRPNVVACPVALLC